MAQRGIISFLTHDAPDGGAASLAQVLDARVREGELVERQTEGAVRCFACGHRCLVRPGRRGICKVRFNRDGTLYVPAGYVAALQCDPTEKKPFFHVLPGSDTLTFGMLGCDFHCGYCQNWLTSQALRDDSAGVLPTDVTPDALVRPALRQGEPHERVRRDVSRKHARRARAARAATGRQARRLVVQRADEPGALSQRE